MAQAPQKEAAARRRVLGLRASPGRLALVVFRLPLGLYRRGWGWVLGHTFLHLVHVGRRTGRPFSTVAMVLSYVPDSRRAVICSAWGPDADWVRNLSARPAVRVDIGRETFTPRHRFLDEDEAIAVGVAFRRRHPRRMRFMSWVLGWGDLGSEDALRAFVAARPFVELQPAEA